MLKYVMIPRPGDRESALENVARLSTLSQEELLSKYNRQVEIGIVGVHAQAVMLLALRHIMLKVFGDSPVKFEENVLISLSGKARIVDGKLEYEEPEE